MVGMKIGKSNKVDLLRIPTEYEIFGENIYSVDEPYTAKRFKGMKNPKNRIAFDGHEGNQPSWYWLQNNAIDSAAYFAFVYAGGYAGSGYASNTFSVRPVFLLS